MRTPPSYPCSVCQPQTQSGFSGRVIEQRLNIPLLQNVTLAPQEAMQMGAATIVIMNPNYETEIQNMIAGMGWTAEVAVLNEASDGSQLKHVS